LRNEGLLGYRNPKKIKNKYKKDLTNVINLTPCGAYFIISLLCDGHLRKRNVQFKFRKRDCVEFRDIICNILKITPPLNIWCRKASEYIWWQRGGVKKTIGECGEFRIYSRELVELLVTKYGLPLGKKSGIIRIPQKIMDSADPKILGAVMRSVYECEGGVNLHKKSLCVTIGNTSIQFLQEIAELLENNKIENNIYSDRLKISSLESVIMFYELIYCVFNLKLHVTAKKTGLEALIEYKSKKRP